MPKVTLTYNSEADIPAGLKPFKNANANTVDIWVNTDETAMAAELNPSLETNRNAIIEEKRILQQKYDNLLSTSAATATELNELKIAQAAKTGVSKEDLDFLTEAKKLGTLDELKTMKSNYPKLEADSKTLKDNEIFSHSGFKNRKIFNDLMSNPEKVKGVKDFVVKEVQDPANPNDATKKVKQVFAQVENGSEIALSEFAKQNWADYLPLLDNGGGNDAQQQASNSWVKQTNSGGGNDAQQGAAIAGIGSQGNSLLNTVVGNLNKQAQSTQNPFATNTAQSQQSQVKQN